jgi:hypothetical protein
MMRKQRRTAREAEGRAAKYGWEMSLLPSATNKRQERSHCPQSKGQGGKDREDSPVDILLAALEFSLSLATCPPPDDEQVNKLPTPAASPFQPPLYQPQPQLGQLHRTIRPKTTTILPQGQYSQGGYQVGGMRPTMATMEPQQLHSSQGFQSKSFQNNSPIILPQGQYSQGALFNDVRFFDLSSLLPPS